MSDILWRRLRYALSPQWDIYHHLAPKLLGKTVMDVGCGTGFGALCLTSHARMVVGLDADWNAAHFGDVCIPGVRFAHRDITTLDTDPIPAFPMVYDAVVMVEVLEHIEDYGKALRNAREMLVYEGLLYVTARNASADLRRNDLHLREWTAAEFKAQLSEHFRKVTLWDYSLTVEQDETTHMTPLVAVCQK